MQKLSFRISRGNVGVRNYAALKRVKNVLKNRSKKKEVSTVAISYENVFDLKRPEVMKQLQGSYARVELQRMHKSLLSLGNIDRQVKDYQEQVKSRDPTNEDDIREMAEKYIDLIDLIDGSKYYREYSEVVSSKELFDQVRNQDDMYKYFCKLLGDLTYANINRGQGKAFQKKFETFKEYYPGATAEIQILDLYSSCIFDKNFEHPMEVISEERDNFLHSRNTAITGKKLLRDLFINITSANKTYDIIDSYFLKLINPELTYNLDQQKFIALYQGIRKFAQEKGISDPLVGGLLKELLARSESKMRRSDVDLGFKKESQVETKTEENENVPKNENDPEQKETNVPSQEQQVGTNSSAAQNAEDLVQENESTLNRNPYFWHGQDPAEKLYYPFTIADESVLSEMISSWDELSNVLETQKPSQIGKTYMETNIDLEEYENHMLKIFGDQDTLQQRLKRFNEYTKPKTRANRIFPQIKRQFREVQRYKLRSARHEWNEKVGAQAQ